MVNWSELPSDVLGHVTSFLPIQDYHRFSAVCQKWSKVAKQKFHSPAQMLPWLVLGEDKDTKKRKFYDLSEDRHYYLDVSELHSKFLCGSKYGWLFALDQKLNLHLVNPLTREYYNLPSPPACYEGYLADVALYLETESDDEDAHGRKLEELQQILLLKTTLDYDPSKKSEFTVLIMFWSGTMLSFWRPGHDGWTNITGLPKYVDDIAFYNGKFYAIRSPMCGQDVILYTIDVGLEPKATSVVLHGDHNLFIGYSVRYIVDLDGELLIVERLLEILEHMITKQIVVHKVDLERESIIACQDIEGRTVFLGTNSPMIINPDKFLGCKKDAIYFTDLVYDDNHTEYGAEDLGVYDLVENTITSYYPNDIFHPLIGAPIWFTPNPW